MAKKLSIIVREGVVSEVYIDSTDQFELAVIDYEDTLDMLRDRMGNQPHAVEANVDHMMDAARTNERGQPLQRLR